MSSKILLFASGNSGKLKEVQTIAAFSGWQVVSPKQLQGKIPPHVEENASTYEGNAKLKAQAYFDWSGLPSLADDSGIEVDALGGAPGVRSARYAGENASDQQNNTKLLEAMAEQTNRSARYVCHLHFKIAEDLFFCASGTLEGQIYDSPQGVGGFGYDPLFMVDGLHRSLAQLKTEGVEVETHRIKALKALFTHINTKLPW